MCIILTSSATPMLGWRLSLVPFGTLHSIIMAWWLAGCAGCLQGDPHVFFSHNIWLVVWNMFIFPYIGNNHPN